MGWSHDSVDTSFGHPQFAGGELGEESASFFHVLATQAFSPKCPGLHTQATQTVIANTW